MERRTGRYWQAFFEFFMPSGCFSALRPLRCFFGFAIASSFQLPASGLRERADGPLGRGWFSELQGRCQTCGIRPKRGLRGVQGGCSSDSPAGSGVAGHFGPQGPIRFGSPGPIRAAVAGKVDDARVRAVPSAAVADNRPFGMGLAPRSDRPEPCRTASRRPMSGRKETIMDKKKLPPRDKASRRTSPAERKEHWPRPPSQRDPRVEPLERR